MAWGGDLGALGAGLLLTNALRQKDVRVRLVRDVDLNGTVLRVGMTTDRKRKGKTKKSNRPRKIHEIFQPLIRQLVAGRQPLEPLFVAGDGGFHTESWLRAAVKRVCRTAGVPEVCPHSLKGTSGTILAEGGEQVDKVVEHLSHEHRKVSERHYLADGTLAAAQAERTFAVIIGGKR
jgi:integrase